MCVFGLLAFLSPLLAQMIAFLEDPEFGQAAFDWLCGDDPGKPGLLAVSMNFGPLVLTNIGPPSGV